MNTINTSINNTDISDFLVSNETNPEPLSFKDIKEEIVDSSIKINVDPIKVFQNAGSKLSDIMVEKYNVITENITFMDQKKLHGLSPLQYPLFTNNKPEISSIMKSSIFLGSSLALILFFRYKNRGFLKISNKKEDDNICKNTVSSTIQNTDKSTCNIIDGVAENNADNNTENRVDISPRNKNLHIEKINNTDEDPEFVNVQQISQRLSLPVQIFRLFNIFN